MRYLGFVLLILIGNGHTVSAQSANQYGKRAYDVILQALGFGPCVEQVERCGSKDRGYKMIQTDKNTGLCVEICSTRPYMNVGYQCGTCEVTCPSNATIPCWRGIGLKMFRVDDEGICDEICIFGSLRADGYSCGVCGSTSTRAPITAPVAPPVTIVPPTPVTAPLPIITPVQEPLPTAPLAVPIAAPIAPPIAPPVDVPVAPPSSLRYQITLDLVNMTSSDRDAFVRAAAQWESVITDDLPDVPSTDFDKPPGTTGCSYPSTVDDLYICGTFSEIDGVGMVAGRARPTFIRNRAGGRLPSAGEMIFDIADVDAVRELGILGPLLAHEMGHVIGKRCLSRKHSSTCTPMLEVH
jgi:hypothetical protein